MNIDAVDPRGAPQFREEHQLGVARCLLILALAVFVPSGLRYWLGFNSMAPGVLVSCAAICGIAGLGLLGSVRLNTLSQGWIVGTLVILGVSAHLGFSLFQSSADLNRAFTSLALLATMLAAAPVVYQAVLRADDRTIGDALAIVRVALLVMAALAMLNIQPTGDLVSERPVWPFTEPSHYALTAAPFFIHACVQSRQRVQRWFWLAAMAVIVMLLKSVALGVILVIAAVCSLGLAELALFGIAAGVGLQFIDLGYFTDRINISYASSNLSALVYLQGLELIQEAIATTRGWGIAFQQLGFAPTNVLATEMIRRVGGGEQNLSDGSFMAVKLGAEFGLIGIALLIAYLYKMIGAIIHLRLVAMGRARSPISITFGLSVYVSLFVELFVRGIGYFSGTLLLGLASVGIVALTRFQPVPTTVQASPFRIRHVG